MFVSIKFKFDNSLKIILPIVLLYAIKSTKDIIISYNYAKSPSSNSSSQTNEEEQIESINSLEKSVYQPKQKNNDEPMSRIQSSYF